MAPTHFTGAANPLGSLTPRAQGPVEQVRDKSVALSMSLPAAARPLVSQPMFGGTGDVHSPHAVGRGGDPALPVAGNAPGDAGETSPSAAIGKVPHAGFVHPSDSRSWVPFDLR